MHPPSVLAHFCTNWGEKSDVLDDTHLDMDEHYFLHHYHLRRDLCLQSNTKGVGPANYEGEMHQHTGSIPYLAIFQPCAGSSHTCMDASDYLEAAYGSQTKVEARGTLHCWTIVRTSLVFPPLILV